MASLAEIGAIDEAAARDSFEAALESLQECVSEGSRQNSMLAGSIEFAVKVNAKREAASVWAVESSLGQRVTERCMFDALRSVSWPAPVGGTFAIARTSFEFDVPKGVRPPTSWDAGRVSKVVEALEPKVDHCTEGRRGDVLVTLYLDPEGKAISAGASSSSETDETAIECLIDLLLEARFPAPGEHAAKVRFYL